MYFEFDFPFLMAVGIALLGVVVLVGAWVAGAAPTPNGGGALHASSVRTEGDNYGSSRWKTTWHRTRAASVATALFFPTLIVVLRAVRALNLDMDRRERRVWLQHPYEGQPLVQSGP